MTQLSDMGESEVTLVISRVKEEHVLHTVKMLNECGKLLESDGTDIGIDISVETARDGCERVHEFLALLAEEDQ